MPKIIIAFCGLFVFTFLGHFLYTVFKKKAAELSLSANCIYTISLVTNITPAFKGNVKVEYAYSYLDQRFEGVTFADKNLGYKTGQWYFTKIDGKKPSISVLSNKSSAQNNAPRRGWKVLPSD